MAEHLVLDIETVPDLDLYTPQYDDSGKLEFPPPWACKIVCVGVILFSEDLTFRKMGAMGEQRVKEGGPPEELILADLASYAQKKKPEIITWNGRRFDMPVISTRAMRYGISMKWYFERKDYRYRFSPDGHLDLADQISDYGATRMSSMDGASKLIGLSGKGSVKGDSVEALWKSGRYEDIRDYCLSDVGQTAFIFLRYLLHAGKIPKDMYIGSAKQLLKELRDDVRTSAFFKEGIDEDVLLLKKVAT